MKPIDIEATRIAQVNPTTGHEIPVAFTGDDLDQTILARPEDNIQAGRRTTEQYIPRLDVRPTGETTSVWTEDNPLLKWLRARWPEAPKKQRYAIGAIAATMLIIAGTGLILWSNPSIPIRVPLSKQSNKVPHHPAQIMATLPADRGSTASPPASLKKAIEHLTNGELKQSAEEYQQLLQHHPDNRSYRVALAILNGQRSQ